MKHYTMRTLLGGLALTLALFLVFAIDSFGQSGVKRQTVIGANDSIGNAANPTGSVFTVKLLMTQGLVKTASTVVGSLPTCNTASKGQLYEVTDANGPTYGGTLTGSSTTLALALCDGTNWVAH